jgi:thiol-disulfide isomerase/thioredoxin
MPAYPHHAPRRAGAARFSGRRFPAALGAAAIALSLAAGCANAPERAPPAGAAPPPPSARTAHALPDTVREDWLGRVVVVDFWAVWCRPCLASSPQVQDLHERYEADDRVLVVAAHADDGAPENPTAHARSRGMTYPVIDRGQHIKLAMEVYGLPTFVVLDPEGREAFKHAGYLGPDGRERIARVVEALLAEHPW